MSELELADEREPAPAQRHAIVRLGIGLAQGALLYWLYSAADAHLWPATEPVLFAPLALVFLFIPLLVTQGVSGVRSRILFVWALAATVILAIFGAHDRMRAWTEMAPTASGIDPAVLPAFVTVAFSAAFLFIGHALVSSADADRQWIARYRTYFDTAWKGGVQAALSGCFVGAFWLLLLLGSALFKLITLSFLEKLIEHAWFAIPATALAAATALHLTDVRARLIAGIRNVALVLLSWLLPVMTLLAAGFLGSLLFTGLEPLWRTRSAAALLLVAAAALVVLINAALQDATPENRPALILRLSASVASFALIPLASLAAYAVYLRVRQYGWTEDRVVSAACVCVAFCYALGYAAAAGWHWAGRSSWLALTGPVNIAAAFVAVSMLLCLFSPIADPARLAVNSQMDRLRTGRIDATHFDFNWLRFGAGRYGHEALMTLAADRRKEVRERAREALAKTELSHAFPTRGDLEAQISVYPKGRRLPQSLLKQSWGKDALNVPDCLRWTVPCDAFIVDLNGDGSDEVLFVSGPPNNWTGIVVTRSPSDSWTVAGMVAGARCSMALNDMRRGIFAVVAPSPPKWRAIDAGNSRLEIVPGNAGAAACAPE